MTVTLADELAAELPRLWEAEPAGATLVAACRALAAGRPEVRAAFDALDGDGRARLVRRRGERALRLLPVTSPVLACASCHGEFERPHKSRRATCSRPCAVALSWRGEGARERRVSGIKAQRATPEGKANTVGRNIARWARPGERERLGELNRERWADPVAAAERAAAMRATNGTEDNRLKASDIRKAAWADPETRERYLAGIRAGKATERSSANSSMAMVRRWRDPAQREKFLRGRKREP